jgi:hypothetical protein
MADPQITPVEEILSGCIPFEQKIREKYRDQCSNCGSGHKLRVKLVVPLEAGGFEIESNGVLLCRACEMSAETIAPLTGTQGARRMINFWVSHHIHSRMSNGMATSRGLRSMSSLVRYLMVSYVEDADRFDDLDKYQGSDPADVKVNVWVPADQYQIFHRLVRSKGLTVTDAIKGLIQMFDSEVTAHKDTI